MSRRNRQIAGTMVAEPIRTGIETESGKVLRAMADAGFLTGERLRVMTEMTDRMIMISRLGRSYGNARDLYQTLGYPKFLTYEDYLSRYKRQGIARAVVQKPVNACWRVPPKLTEPEPHEGQTDFERTWEEFAVKHKVFAFLKRADTLASIGRYAALLIGYADGVSLTTPARPGSDVIYLGCYSERSAMIATFDKDPKTQHFGQPYIYSLRLQTGLASEARSCHWSRIIHIAHDKLEDQVFGQPRLEPIWNELANTELVSGGSAEMFWRGAQPGIQFVPQEGVTIPPKDSPEGKEYDAMINDYIHGMRRDLRMDGVTAEDVSKMQVADPSKHLAAYANFICAAMGIPKRILFGSERGELASNQDTVHWNDTVAERQVMTCEPEELRPLVDRLIEYKAVASPKNGYVCTWQTMTVEGPKEAAQIGEIRARALAEYAQSGGEKGTGYPFREFLIRMAGYSASDADSLLKGMPTRATGGAEGTDSGTSGGEGEEETGQEPFGIGGGSAALRGY